MAEQGGEARGIVRCRDSAVDLVAADHQAQVKGMPGRHHRLEVSIGIGLGPLIGVQKGPVVEKAFPERIFVSPT